MITVIFMLSVFCYFERRGAGIKGCHSGCFCILFRSWCDRAYSVSVFTYTSHRTLFRGQDKQDVMPKYCRMCKFSILVHQIIIFALHKHDTITYSILKELHESELLAHKTYMPGKFFIPGKSSHANTRFTYIFPTCLSFVVFGTWLNIIVLCPSDVHPHPGPSSSSSESTSGFVN